MQPKRRGEAVANGIYIVGIGMTKLGKFPMRSVKDLTQEAVCGALADAGCGLGDIEAAWFSNTRQGIMEGQNGIRGQCALRSMGFQGIPIANVENACASASTGIREAYAHIKADMCDTALVVGVDKMFFPEKKEEMFRAFLGGADVHLLDVSISWLTDISCGIEPKDHAEKETSLRSFFMDYYAAMARMHMRLFGTTQRQIAAVAAKNHFHSTFNPLSQYCTDMSVADILADQLVKYPLTRSMCAPISDGAAAAVLCSDRVLTRFNRSRTVRIAATVLASSSNRLADEFDQHIGRVAALQAYEMAGVGPDDVDVAEVHDACAFAEILQIENLGFCERGRGGPMSERGETRLGGRIPVNPSGGLVSKGHPVGATGVIQLHELVTQLRGEAGARQIADARLAIAENGGGFWGVEEAATTVTILEGMR
jgi:acetyl-CoA acyltransferase